MHYYNGRPISTLTAGETAELYYYNGRPVVVLEYTAGGGAVANAYYYMMNQ